MSTSTSSNVTGKLLDLAQNFVLSAGTVTIDPASPPRILLLFGNQTKEYLLPKGRKILGENLADAAVRETFEETGYKATLRSHDLPTQAVSTQHDDNPIAHKEPMACQQRITASGVRKIVFWYVATGDSRAVKVGGTQDQGEDFTSLWVDAENDIELLTFDDDRMIARLALQAVTGNRT